MKVAKRAAVVVGGVLVLVVVIGMLVAFLVDRSMRARTREAQQAQRGELARLRERILDDQRVLAGHWLFSKGGGAGDASTLLEPRTGWRGVDETPRGDPGVPAALIEQLKGWGTEWASHVDDAALDGADLTWMKELARYDYWDLEAEGSPRNTRPWQWHDAPFPDFIPLQAAAKARLLQGIRAGAPLEAVQEVRALARLCASTETLIGEMIAVALLAGEGKARDAAQARGLDLSAWPEVTKEEVLRAKRTVWGALAFFQLLALEGAGDTAMANTIQVGRCAALFEGGANALFLRQFLGERYAERFRELGEAIDSSPCRLKNLRRTWAAIDGEGELALDAELFCTVAVGEGADPPPGCGALGAVLWLPYTKEAIGEILLSMGSPSYLRFYDEQAAIP